MYTQAIEVLQRTHTSSFCSQRRLMNERSTIHIDVALSAAVCVCVDLRSRPASAVIIDVEIICDHRAITAPIHHYTTIAERRRRRRRRWRRSVAAFTLYKDCAASNRIRRRRRREGPADSRRKLRPDTGYTRLPKVGVIPTPILASNANFSPVEFLSLCLSVKNLALQSWTYPSIFSNAKIQGQYFVE